MSSSYRRKSRCYTSSWPPFLRSILIDLTSTVYEKGCFWLQMKKRNSESLDPFAHYFENSGEAFPAPPCKSTVPHDNRFLFYKENESGADAPAMQNYNTSIWKKFFSFIPLYAIVYNGISWRCKFSQIQQGYSATMIKTSLREVAIKNKGW